MTIDAAAVGVVDDAPRAGVLLKPVRLKILDAAREPASATSIAAALGLARQNVNYHVRTLARAGFLRRAGRVRKRGLVEQRYVVTAKAFVLAPDVLGQLSPVPHEGRRIQHAEKMSATYLLMLAAQMQQEVGRGWHAAAAQQKRLPVFGLDAEFSFDSAEQRARFATALASAITRVIAEHSRPAQNSTRRYRLALGCYPIPSTVNRQPLTVNR